MNRLYRYVHRFAAGHWPALVTLYLGTDVGMPICRACLVDACRADARRIGAGPF